MTVNKKASQIETGVNKSNTRAVTLVNMNFQNKNSSEKKGKCKKFILFSGSGTGHPKEGFSGEIKSFIRLKNHAKNGKDKHFSVELTEKCL